MAENEFHKVYLMGGNKEDGDLFVWEVYPERTTFDRAIRGEAAELVASSADAELMSFSGFSPAEWIQCDVLDKNGKIIGTTRKRSPIYEYVAQDVAEMLNKKRVKICIR